MVNPFFSIVMPTYNRAEWLTHSISSVMRQSFTDWELIVIDDGSADQTGVVVNSFRDNRVRYLYQAHGEKSAARNRGIQHASGKYVCFLDSDDEYLPDHLSTLYNNLITLGEPVALLFVNTLFNGKKLPDKQEDGLLQKNPAVFFLKYPVGNPRVCVHKSILDQNQFDARLSHGEDVHLWIRISTAYRIIHLPVYTVNCSLHEESDVHLLNNDAPPDMHGQIRICEELEHTGLIPVQVRNEVLSGLYFRLAKHHYLNNRFWPMALSVFRSIMLIPSHRSNKSKLYLLKSYLLGPRITHFE